MKNITNKNIVTASVPNNEEIKTMMDYLTEDRTSEDALNLIPKETYFKKRISNSIKICNLDEKEKIKHIIATRYLNSIKNKGETAQELAYLMLEEEFLEINTPKYIKDALEWIQ